VSGWLVVMQTYVYYFPLSLSLSSQLELAYSFISSCLLSQPQPLMQHTAQISACTDTV